MVMEDPDAHEMFDSDGIGIFIPGTEYEREVDWGVMVKVFTYVGIAFFLMFVSTFVLIFGLIAVDLIHFDLIAGTIEFRPWSLVILTFSEIGLMIPPIVYVRRRGLSLSAIGLRRRISIPTEITLGLGVGAAMIVVNIVVSWLISQGTGIGGGDEELFLAYSPAEVVGWIIVMFVIVGFGEELLFRSFLQRRMETYLLSKTRRNKLAALVATSILFSAFHLDAFGFPLRFALGMMLGYLAQRRNYSVLGPSVAHGLNNSFLIIAAALGF
ncbi:MAG: CPBP family intramembrane metalloprotease [Candidatus Thorarchaeota archaeon]|nr:MAG: CPBP family intramembrane metalloprotease [Candidatus Thorarchaeota archaeon]